MDDKQVEQALEHDAAVAREQKQMQGQVPAPAKKTWRCPAGHSLFADGSSVPPLTDMASGRYACPVCIEDWKFKTFPAVLVTD